MTATDFPSRGESRPSAGPPEHILVTGGAGFIGSRLVGALRPSGARIRVLDALVESVHGADPRVSPSLEGVEFLRGDIRDAEAVARALEDVDLVYHLAAETGTGESMYRARHYVDVNVGGTAVLMDAIAAREARPRRLVLASSRAVYGEGPYRRADGSVCHPGARGDEALRAGRWEPELDGEVLEPIAMSAASRPAPTSVYGETKRAQESLAGVMGTSLGVDVWTLRLQNVYGPGQSTRNPYTGILSIFSVLLLEGKGLRVFEDGLETRDFVYVDDVVEAFVRAGRAPGPGAVVDVGSGVRSSVLDVALTLVRALGLSEDRVTITGEYRLGDIRHAFADTTALADRLQYRPPTSFATGVARLLEWVSATERPGSRLDEALREMSERGLLGVRE